MAAAVTRSLRRSWLNRVKSPKMRLLHIVFRGALERDRLCVPWRRPRCRGRRPGARSEGRGTISFPQLHRDPCSVIGKAQGYCAIVYVMATPEGGMVLAINPWAGIERRCSRAVISIKNPNHVGGRLVVLHACRRIAIRARPRDQIDLRACPRRALSGTIKNVGPSVKHWREVIAALHVADAQHPRFLGAIVPGERVEHIRVWRGHVMAGGRWILADLGD